MMRTARLAGQSTAQTQSNHRKVCGKHLVERRGALLGSAAAVAIALVIPGTAQAEVPAACTVTGASMTCQGAVTPLSVPAGVSTLTISAATQDISATTGNAITFNSTGSITIDSNLSMPSPPGGGFSLVAADGYGMLAKSTGAATPVNVSSVGDIGAKWGITAFGSGAVTLNSSGNVSSTGAVPSNAGVIPLEDVVKGGLAAWSNKGAVTLTNKGDVTAQFYGLFAFSNEGVNKVSVNSTGNVTSSNWDAVFAGSNEGSVEVVSVGNVSAKVGGFIVWSRGDTSVTSTGDITAAGKEGIRAYSEDVPEGAGGNVTVVSKGSITSKLDGIQAVARLSGVVKVDSSGDVTSTDSRGIVAESEVDAVTVTSDGDVRAKAEGILAQSEGSAKVSVTVGSGEVSSETASAISLAGDGDLAVSLGGTATGAATAGAAGVRFGDGTLNGASNSLIVLSGGLVDNAGGINGMAVLGNSGGETVSNFGTVTGKVDLGSGSNGFVNEKGGNFNMGASVTLGSGNLLTNAGTLSAGGNGVVATTALTGNLAQTADGLIVVDVNLATGASDLINVSGTAILDGTITIKPLGAPAALSSTFNILSAAGGITDGSLKTMDSVTTSLSLIFPDANTLALKVTVDFAVDDLNPNQTRIARNLDTLIGDAGGVTPVLDALAGIGELGGYKHALNQLLPEAYLHAAMAGVLGAQAFSDTLTGCREREGTYAYMAEGKCLWMDAGGGNLDRDKTDDYLDSDQTQWWLGGGVQFALSDTVRASAGGRYEHVTQDVYDNASNDGSWGHIGASLSYTPGPWLLTGALSGGKGWIDTERDFDFEGFSGSAEGEQDPSYLHGKLRAAYLFDMGKWYAKPILDVDVIWLSHGDVKEDDGDGAGLDVSSQQETVLSATPMLELGGQMETANGTIVRPYLRVGAAVFGDTSLSVDSAFTDAPGGTPRFMTELAFDPVLANVSAGLDVLAVDHLNVRLSYDGMFGETTRSNAGTLRLEWRL